ncbi:hypothetical protein BT67DRAFT_423812 [Trichocladium antarcticum]|uniref:CAP-Gly domain-containing protein n=1 Tax=Trichocladium antarcticum TaxID=1450529 RepID=A0AAN6UHZ8_9PEZI|nr:hypothetical protein BT67DRAFT_423812 [Trichocladium antarcticum]
MSELAIGQTIQLSDGRTGTIRFLGQTAFADDDWVGIELDDDSGKNDGSVYGERYFDCPAGHGMFVRPTKVSVLAQPPPPPPPPPKPAAKKTRPSSLLSRASAPADAGLNKRMSLNVPSPSPATRPSRSSSAARSPTRSPTKQLGATPSSGVPSRTGTPSITRTVTPSNARPGVGPRPRPSATAVRTSMAPPPMPAPRPARQVSAAAPRPVGAPARALSGRLAAGPRPSPIRPPNARHGSSGSHSGVDNGRPAGKRGSGSSPSPRRSSDDDSHSPQPTSPVQLRTMALEKLTGSTSTPPAASVKPPAAATAAPRSSTNVAAAGKEIEDLKTKLRVLEKKRIEDREKLNTLEKTKSERDKFERIIQTLQIKYQPQQQEIADLKRQLKEAEARLYNVEDMQADHESALELATLDREMAEEMAEVYKTELDALKERKEELELEAEILREENAEYTKGMSSEERESTGWLQMERNNERLREALLRLRDLSQEQEEELRDQIKGLEEDVCEFDTVKDQYATCRETLTRTESAVEDLREQLNNALGAEDIIESLTEQTMNQSEEIKELKAVIDDLEALKEINDELEINHVQNEREMEDEMELKDAVIAEQIRQAALQKEAAEDMEYTLSRFRELVTSLQGDLEDIRASHAVTENESEQLNSRSRAMMDLNMKLQLSAAKTQVKTIDLELQRMEAHEAEQHLGIVKMFLPDTYQADRDSVLALLRFKRLAFKANLLNGFIKERVNGQPHPGHEDDVFEGCAAVDKLTWVSCMCDRFANAIGHCSPEQFAQYEGALYELEPVERALNGWIDGLRRDDLKEQQCAAELQRTIALMTHLGEVHISNDLESFADDIHMRALLMQSHLESAAVAFATARAMVRRAVPPSSDEDELGQYFAKKAEGVVAQTRSTKVIAGKTVRALEDLKSRSLSLTPDTLGAFEQCEVATGELADMARRIGLDLHRLVREEGRTEPHTYVDVQTCVQNTAMHSFSSSEADLFSTYLNKLRVVTAQISDLAAVSTDLGQTQEFERSTAPWILRSQELKTLKNVPVDTEAEVRRLKDEVNDARRAMAVRDEDFSTAQVKIETLESRMRDAKAKTSRISELEAQITLAHDQIATLSENMAKQDRELKTLELDRDKWKTLASSSSSSSTGRAASGGAAGSGEAGARANQERAVATAREMDALKADMAALQAAVRFLREDSRRARLAQQAELDWLAAPLVAKPPPSPSPAAAEQRRVAMLASEGRAVLAELVDLAAAATVFDLGTLPRGNRAGWKPARSTPQYHAARQAEEWAEWKGWADEVARKGRALAGRPGAAAAAGASGKRPAAARLQIRLPGGDGGKRVGGEVQIVGSREWEGLQGRFAVV